MIVSASCGLEVDRVVDEVRRRRPEAVAVCLLHAWRAPRHERRLGAALRRLGGPGVLSSEVAPEQREVERATTAWADAALVPVVAAAFRRLRKHLMEDRTDVQNIDMMNLAGFCRNCLSRWYQEAAAEKGIEIGKDAAREHVYGMPYAEWKATYQTEATPEQAAAFAKSHSGH